jgi:hypothetical protein
VSASARRLPHVTAARARAREEDPSAVSIVSATLLTCPQCPATLRRAALRDAAVATCAGCGAVYQHDAAAAAPAARCDCAGARAYVRALRRADGWVRCDDCGRLVVRSLRGLDRAARHVRRAVATQRRRELLGALDHLARWAPEMGARATEASPIIGDGNKGGGGKRERTDRSDRLNDLTHDELARAYAVRDKLAALTARGRADTRALRLLYVVTGLARASLGLPLPDPPGPSALERAAAVLEWVAFRATQLQRKRLAESVGWAFIDGAQYRAWGRAGAAGRERAKAHGVPLLALAERAWFGDPVA